VLVCVKVDIDSIIGTVGHIKNKRHNTRIGLHALRTV